MYYNTHQPTDVTPWKPSECIESLQIIINISNNVVTLLVLPTMIPSVVMGECYTRPFPGPSIIPSAHNLVSKMVGTRCGSPQEA